MSDAAYQGYVQASLDAIRSFVDARIAEVVGDGGGTPPPPPPPPPIPPPPGPPPPPPPPTPISGSEILQARIIAAERENRKNRILNILS